MKKIFCICLTLLICFGICGCKKESDGLPNLSADEFETVYANRTNNLVSGEIINKIAPNVLELKTNRSSTDAWGETVYIITDQADKWCVGDNIDVRFSKAQRPHDTKLKVRIIADSVSEHFYGIPAGKPIIYFYPESPTICSAKLAIKGELTCTYPDYDKQGWQNFTAYPDGTLVFPNSKEYYALYWEGIINTEWDFSQGWCIRGEDTAEFLEWALAQQGLTPKEANEFIIYWLPLMQNNTYNVISFQSSAYTDCAKLNITPTPDSMLRILMAYYPTDTKINIPPQTFNHFERHGFTVVEWGGSEVNSQRIS